MSRTRRTPRPALSLRRKGPHAAMMLGLLSACSDPRPLVLIDVGPLPAQPARLRVSLSYDGQPARVPSPILFDLRAHHAGDTASFGVHLPLGTNGDLVVGAGVLDEAGCLAGLGTATSTPIAAQPRVSLALQAPPSDVPSEARCSDPEKTPLLLRVTPRVLASRGDDTRLHLFGWGFVPSGSDCPIVTIDGNTAPNVLCPSFAELSVDPPPGVGRVGRVPVRVLNRTNGRASTRRDLFAYFAKDIVLTPAAAGPVMLSSAISGVTAADLNSDGRADVVVVHRAASRISVLLHDGSGDASDAFPAALQASISVGVRPSSAAVGDLSGDGLADLVISNSGDGTLSVVQQQAAGPLAPFAVARHSRIYANLEPDALALLHANRDGRLDLAVANRLSGDISVFENDGSGSFARSLQRDYDVGRGPTSLVAADFTGDGQTDLLCSDGSRETLSLLAHSGEREFSRQALPAPAGARAVQIAVADVDGDGRADVLRLMPSGSIELWRSGEAGALDSSEVFRAPADLAAFAVVDLDLDERPDVLALSTSQASVYVLRNRSRYGTGSGLFQLAATLPAGPTGSAPSALAVADFDGDGLPDVTVARSGDNSLTFFNNRSQ
ncbi:MAG: VCBS repeat-containing protein [Myxococcales bacterium]|nr:VCBS repeat-containing protein [Myxococcales bacterium]